MPKRNDFHKILVIGSGPCLPGQGGEFDYAAVQAQRTLSDLGYKIITITPNPSAVACDPDRSFKTFVEPLNMETISEIIIRERPGALLPLFGGTTALCLAAELSKSGFLDEYGVKLIGAGPKAIDMGINRRIFCDTVTAIGYHTPFGAVVNSVKDAEEIADQTGYPLVVKASFSQTGNGSFIAYNIDELISITSRIILNEEPSNARVEKSIIGFQEFEFVTLRDDNDEVLTVCGAQNMDPVGIHPGDSATVIPILTVDQSTKDKLEKAAQKITKISGVMGSAYVKIAMDAATEEMIPLGITPGASRIEALFSKLSGTSIAGLSAMLACGLTIDELPEHLSMDLESAFSTDERIAVKLPHWEFDRFEGADTYLNTQMRSIGEVAGVGKTFRTAFQKALYSLYGKETDTSFVTQDNLSDEGILNLLSRPTDRRWPLLFQAVARGIDTAVLADHTGIDPWFVTQAAQLQKKGLDVHPWGPTPIQAIFTDTQKAPGKKVLIIGPGYGRIGQGAELDHACCHAALAVRDKGGSAILLNSNPTSAADTDNTFDTIYFDPVTTDVVEAIITEEKPEHVIIQFGGQSALSMASELLSDGIAIPGLTQKMITLSKDRHDFFSELKKLGIPHPETAVADSREKAFEAADQIGFPVGICPFEDSARHPLTIMMDATMLDQYLSGIKVSADHPVFIQQFLEYAIETQTDALCDGKDLFIPAVIEHIELAGVHPGDSASVIPPYSTPPRHLDTICEYTRKVVAALGIKGILNTRFAVHNDTVYMLEINPRACRTVPLLSRMFNLPMAKLAVRLMMGETISDLGLDTRPLPFYGVMESVFPFDRFIGSDPLIGPDMRSTGHALAIEDAFGMAYYNAQAAIQSPLPLDGTVLITITDTDKPSTLEPARLFNEMGFKILATKGTMRFLQKHDIPCGQVKKMGFGRPDLVDAIKTGEINLVVNTPSGRKSQHDDAYIRKASLRYGTPYITTPAGALAAAKGIAARIKGRPGILSLQERMGR